MEEKEKEEVVVVTSLEHECNTSHETFYGTISFDERGEVKIPHEVAKILCSVNRFWKIKEVLPSVQLPENGYNLADIESKGIRELSSILDKLGVPSSEYNPEKLSGAEKKKRMVEYIYGIKGKKPSSDSVFGEMKG